MRIEENPRSSTKIPIPNLKIVILGDLGVGKTCLRSQFVYHIFTNAYKATIGGDYLTTKVEIPQQTQTKSKAPEYQHEQESEPESCTKLPQLANLQIWDTAGQERFNSISQAFYRGTDVVVLVYDVTNYESVLSIRDWFTRFMEHCHVERPGVIIVGNKIDKSSERCVDRDEIREILNKNTAVKVDNYVRNWDTDLQEVSSKRLDLVEGVFNRVGQLGLELLDGSDNKDTKNILSFDSIDLHEAMSRNVSSRCLC